MSPFLAFTSLDRKSVRFTIPLSTIRRVERLNARAGIYALSLSTWHGMKIVSINFFVILPGCWLKYIPRSSSWLPFVRQQISFALCFGMHSRSNYREVKWDKLKDLWRHVTLRFLCRIPRRFRRRTSVKMEVLLLPKRMEIPKQLTFMGV